MDEDSDLFNPDCERSDWSRMLLLEHLEHDDLDQKAIDRFQTRRVPRTAIIHPSSIRMTRGRFAGNRFKPHPEGAPVFTFTIENGFEIVDLVAWEWSDRNERLASFHERAFALGEEQILNPATYAFGKALRVHQSPLAWLRSERCGIVILKPEEAYVRLGGVDALEADDSEHARALKKLMEPRPRITFRGNIEA